MKRTMALALVLSACALDAEPPRPPADVVYLDAIERGETLCQATYEMRIDAASCLEPMLCTTPDPPRVDCFGCLRWTDDGQELAFSVHLGTDYHSGYCRGLELP